MDDTNKKQWSIYQNPQDTIKEPDKGGMFEPKRDIFIGINQMS